MEPESVDTSAYRLSNDPEKRVLGWHAAVDFWGKKQLADPGNSVIRRALENAREGLANAKVMRDEARQGNE